MNPGRPSYSDSRWHPSHLMAVALGASDQMTIALLLKVFSTAEPAFETMAVVTAQVVNDH